MNLKLKLEDIPVEQREIEQAEIVDVMQVNWKPHPPMVGPENLEASKGMYLDFNAAGCSWRGPDSGNGERRNAKRCGKTYEEHTCDTALAIKLKRQLVSVEENQAVQDWVTAIVEQLTGIDGVVMLETAEKYRFYQEAEADLRLPVESQGG